MRTKFWRSALVGLFLILVFASMPASTASTPAPLGIDQSSLMAFVEQWIGFPTATVRAP